MYRFFFAIMFAIGLQIPAANAQLSAQTFEDRDTLLSELHEHLQAKNLVGAFNAMLPKGNYQVHALRSMQSIIDEQLAPRLFNITLVSSADLEGGFERELYAYWTGNSYLYAVITYHVRDTDTVALQLFVHGQLSDALKQM